MKIHVRTLAPVLASLFFLIAGAAWLNAQITNAIQAHIHHSFIIGDKTLPPGDYTFRIESNSDLTAMTARNQQGDVVAQFMVRQSMDNHRPRHSELVFRRYGNAEFLSKIYESGSRNGVAVTETGKEERQLVSAGQHGIEHTEEEP
ncbi:MAG TPA: hypothetical protein VME17_21560 [Bryobacteraceae bacterium]|nr:hypothetical protein [Bryobacteraceae bacterium]